MMMKAVLWHWLIQFTYGMISCITVIIIKMLNINKIAVHLDLKNCKYKNQWRQNRVYKNLVVCVAYAFL